MSEATRMSSSPEYLICLECESPCYFFVWRTGTLREILCEVCGNEDIDTFAQQEDVDAIESHWEQHRK